MQPNTDTERFHFLLSDPSIERNAKKTAYVVAFTILIMFLEVIAGYITGSMALLADGYHMASHVGALGFSLIAYRLAQSKSFNRHFSFGAGKLIPLGGYTSAIVLGLIALLMALESLQRLRQPEEIEFNKALLIAGIGLVVNLASAWILKDGPFHDHAHDHPTDSYKLGEHACDHRHSAHDHNIRSAYLHVIADALTSALAIAALAIGKFYGVLWLDSAIGLVGAVVILHWSYSLCRETGWELLDGHCKTMDWDKAKELLESHGAQVVDLRVWRIAPKALACELTVTSENRLGPDHYRNLLLSEFDLKHIVVEERIR